jgi:hypothetical protein
MKGNSMAKRSEQKKEDSKSEPPSSGLAFMVGLILFGLIFCPAGLFLFYNMAAWNRLDTSIFSTLILGCFTGLIIAIIPAYIFMRQTMKRIRK